MERLSLQTRLATSTEHAQIYKGSMEEARWGAVFPGVEASIPILQIKFPSFGAKSVHPSVNLPSGNARGNWAECSTELAPIIEFLAQGSIKPEPRWLVPLRQPKMPENEWKPMLRLFH